MVLNDLQTMQRSTCDIYLGQSKLQKMYKAGRAYMRRHNRAMPEPCQQLLTQDRRSSNPLTLWLKEDTIFRRFQSESQGCDLAQAVSLELDKC
jgi:hypothetical protein